MIDSLCTKARAVAHALERALEVAELESGDVDVILEAADGGVERRLVIEPGGAQRVA